ncbi:MAG: aminotransferase class III-fold pyridoxal phosphate-dependent enzyme [Bacteroidetes bacterium]|nr:aminotransferase class III-fold pyridoxal phosphate-dependent enzyme [Bacteroidota bacterium]
MGMNMTDMIHRRDKLLGPAYRLHYPNDPLTAERAEGVWIYDSKGRKYLDTYNNVPHIGHCHPRVVEAVSKQVARFNSHSRYLHHTILDYSERLLATFEDALDTIHFGCSGTEANELALRLARNYTSNQGVIVTDCAYHGHSQAIYEISTRDVPKAKLPDYVVSVPTPDTFRGEHRGNDAGAQYLKHVTIAIDTLHKRGYGVAALIFDTVQSSGGTVIPPANYYLDAAEMVRNAGGLFIADEVQAGFARIGSHFWVYQGHNVVPDFVTLGKPMGNGLPLAACVTQRKFVENFAATNKYFNTFAGTPVTCAAGLAVLEVIEEEKLQQNAQQIGEYIKSSLQTLAKQYDCIGDVRGNGFFIGLDFISDQKTLEPATTFTEKMVYAMKDRGVLSGAIGPHMNVLKIRPPMCFSKENAKLLLGVIEESLFGLCS